jgi:16S rRNA (uracil1498-N3)-methyltransferase
MRRTRLFVPPAELRAAAAAATLTVRGDDHRHLARVLRVAPGDAVTLFDGAGGEALAQVARVGRAEIELQLAAAPAGSAPTGPAPASRAAIVLLVSVPKGARMDLLVQKTVELGVSRIVPVLSARAVARPEPGRRARWLKIAREAARQCGRADVPGVEAAMPLADALALPDLPPRRLALFEAERARSLRAALAEPAGPSATALLVGPEGGFAPGEIDAAAAHGFLAVGLGPRILRVETAAIIAVGLVAAANGDLD